jgi:Rrf2 family protein
MRVSAKAEYACVAMVELAAREGEKQPVQVKQIADAHGISPRFLVQILLQLKGAGLVASSRGSSGGYQLTRAPQTIRVADIINVFDRSPQGHSALTSLPQSLVVQAVRDVWQTVTQEEERILERTTLADLVQRAQADDTASYQI